MGEVSGFFALNSTNEDFRTDNTTSINKGTYPTATRMPSLLIREFLLLGSTLITIVSSNMYYILLYSLFYNSSIQCKKIGKYRM